MKKSLKYRETIGDVRRVVVKLGTRVLVRKTGRPDMRRMASIVKEVASLRHAGYEVLVVSSGAIGAGMEALGMRTRPTKLPDLQMAAAVGQSRLMAKYDQLFEAERCRVGQVLLTRGDFDHKIRMVNARRTIDNLLRHSVIPIVNENDVVAYEEIQAVTTVGDNDLLSALVVKLIRADLLVMLSTVTGLVRSGKSGRSERVPYLESITPSTFKLVSGSAGTKLSTGGMRSKLRAARDAARSGAAVVIADGRKSGIIGRIMDGEDVGTFVLPSV